MVALLAINSAPSRLASPRPPPHWSRPPPPPDLTVAPCLAHRFLGFVRHTAALVAPRERVLPDIYLAVSPAASLPPPCLARHTVPSSCPECRPLGLARNPCPESHHLPYLAPHGKLPPRIAPNVITAQNAVTSPPRSPQKSAALPSRVCRLPRNAVTLPSPHPPRICHLPRMLHRFTCSAGLCLG